MEGVVGVVWPQRTGDAGVEGCVGGVGFKPQRTGDAEVEGWVGEVGFKPQKTGDTGVEGVVGVAWPQRAGGSGGERRGRASFLDSNLSDPKFINMP